ncbi:MAG TPA: acyl-CoA dehydrogenase family protein [Yinghuangia sp.]|nr:acyl-CoA dehydrogenase family protein [Yinghuangia sp.]
MRSPRIPGRIRGTCRDGPPTRLRRPARRSFDKRFDKDFDKDTARRFHGRTHRAGPDTAGHTAGTDDARGHTMAWDFSTEPEFEEQLDWMRGFVRDEIYPLETLHLDYPALQAATAPLKEQVKARGLWAAHLPPELGGQGFGQVKLGLMHEILGRTAYGPVVFGNNAPDSGNAELLAHGIAASGREWQRDKWLRPLLDGQIRSGFSMTEPDTAGSDPTLLATRAVRDGDEWVIDGHKWFTSNGSVADILIAMVVTDPDAKPHNRASMIVVPADTPGVEIVRDVVTLEDPGRTERLQPAGFGGHAEIRYHSVRVPYENLLGNEGDGFKLAQLRLGPGRIHHCMRWLGQAQRAMDMLCERALSRHAHGTLLAEKQTVQNWIADSYAEIQAARLMTLHAAWRMDRDGAPAARTEISAIKFFGAKVLYDVIDRAIQIHGALGFSADLPLERMYRWARASRIYDGPDEVHRVTVARRVLRGYEPVDVPTEHVPTRREAARKKFAAYLDAAEGQA